MVLHQVQGQGNSFVTSIHYVARRMNLATIDATKVPTCKELFREIDLLLNSMAMYFKKFYKRKALL